MKYEYLRLITTCEHAIILALCIIGIIILFKGIIIEKLVTTDAPKKIFITDWAIISSIIFMFITSISQVAYLGNFFERIPVYYYKIPMLFLLIVAITIIIFLAINKRK